MGVLSGAMGYHGVLCGCYVMLTAMSESGGTLVMI